METRKLGKSGLKVAPLIFGGNVLGWTADEPTSCRILDGFVAAGFNAIDTADMYSKWAPGHTGGESETVIGRWIAQRKNRDKVLIFTKLGMEMSPGNKGLSKAYILRAVEDSLRRLQTDYIDLYQSHTDDAETPFEETLGAYSELIKQGKVRVIGASNYKADRLAAALDTSRKLSLPAYTTLQPNYNLYNREDYEAQLEPLCLKEGLGVINYYPLAGGFLSGKYRSEADLGTSARAGFVRKFLTGRGMKILDALDVVAKRYEATPARVALAWLLARPSITAPIVSATSMEQLYDVLAAVLLKLDDQSIQQLNDASATEAHA